MFLHMNKNLRFFTNIFPEISEVDIFILNIVKDFKKKKFPCKKSERKKSEDKLLELRCR